MTPTELITRAKAHCATSGAAYSTVSRKLLGGGKELERLEERPGAIGFDRLANAFDRLRALEAEFRLSQKDAA